MAELKTTISPFDVAKPQLLERAGSIAEAQKYNVLVEQSRITKAQTKNPVPKSENTREIHKAIRENFDDQIEVGKNMRNVTGNQFYTGSASPYPTPNNFLHNARTGSGTTNFER